MSILNLSVFRFLLRIHINCHNCWTISTEQHFSSRIVFNHIRIHFYVQLQLILHVEPKPESITKHLKQTLEYYMCTEWSRRNNKAKYNFIEFDSYESETVWCQRMSEEEKLLTMYIDWSVSWTEASDTKWKKTHKNKNDVNRRRWCYCFATINGSISMIFISWRRSPFASAKFFETICELHRRFNKNRLTLDNFNGKRLFFRLQNRAKVNNINHEIWR